MADHHSSANALVRAAVRTVLAGGALATAFGVAQAADAQATPAQDSNNPPATANAAPLQLQTVVVTGTLIATTPGQVEMSAVSNINPAMISESGAASIEQLLDKLPQVTASQNSTVSNGASGTSEVDLYDLGAKRTLVLVDGNRLNPGDPISGGPADLDMIPDALISNIQVLTGGASTIYGADAAAGVVNFQLDQHFQGIKVVLNGSLDSSSADAPDVRQAITNFETTNSPLLPFTQAPSSYTGGAQKEVTIIAGLNTPDGNGNATFYASYLNVAPVLQSEYPWSSCAVGSGFSGGANSTGGKFDCEGSGTGYPGEWLDYQPGAPFSPNGYGDMTIVPSTGQVVGMNNSALYNFGPLNYFQRPDERYTAGALMHYTFNPHATFYDTTMFMDDETLAQIASSGTFFDSYKVNCNNPFLSPSEVTSWCTDSGLTSSDFATLYIGRRNVEGGPRIDDLEHQEFLENLGVKGEINSAWNYDASFQYGFTDLSENYENDVSYTKLEDAFDVVDVNGTPECAITETGVTNGPGAGCVPYNIFGHGGSLYLPPNAAVNYLETPGEERGKVQQWITQLVFTGDLGQYGITVPTAKSGAKLAAGVDFREEKDTFLPDEEFQTNDLTGQGSATLPINGDVITREAYTELRVPLVDDKPFIQSLSADLSYRFSGYSPFNGATTSDNTNTYALALDWKPSHDYTVGGNFARAVRAPNIEELYLAETTGNDGTEDPCGGPNPVYSESQCAREGVTANNGTTGYGHISLNPASQYYGEVGGNPNLKPETVLTTNARFTWTPSYIPTLRATFDYYDMKIEDVIESLGENTILNECASSDLFCDLIHRGPGETLWLPGGFVVDTNLNAGTIEEKGGQFEAQYGLPLMNHLGRLELNYSGNYIASYDITSIPGTPSFNCAGYYGSGCAQTGESSQPLPKYRHTLRLTWMTPWEGMDLSADWRYISPVDIYSLSPDVGLGCLNSGCSVANGTVSSTDARIPSYSYLDMQLSGEVPFGDSNFNWIVGVNNLLDKAPPVIGYTNTPPPFGNGNTYPGIYDWMGRYLFVQLSVQL